MRTVAVGIAFMAFSIWCRSGYDRALPAPVAALGALVNTLIATTVATARRRRNNHPRSAPDLQRLAVALVVGAAAGLSLRASLERALEVVEPDHRLELEQVLRDGRQIGLGAALSRAEGSAAPLFGRLARAQVTGAPLLETVAAFAGEERSIRRARGVEAARRLPVKLTIPLALLVLPGFLLLTVAPAAVVSIDRLLGPFMP